MRVVLDTNIFVSGIHWANGSAEKILDIWFDDKFELVSSEEIVEELFRILSSFKVPLSKEDLLHWMSIIASKAILVRPKSKFDLVKEDPDDNKFFEAAFEGGAEYIVSKDRHLLDVGEFEGIKVVSPDEFLKIVNK